MSTKTYPFDPVTGKQLMRAGFRIHPLQPMTQEEVDAQHELVSASCDEEPLRLRIRGLKTRLQKAEYLRKQAENRAERLQTALDSLMGLRDNMPYGH